MLALPGDAASKLVEMMPIFTPAPVIGVLVPGTVMVDRTMLDRMAISAAAICACCRVGAPA